eukprot:gene26299-17392_t
MDNQAMDAQRMDDASAHFQACMRDDKWPDHLLDCFASGVDEGLQDDHFLKLCGREIRKADKAALEVQMQKADKQSEGLQVDWQAKLDRGMKILQPLTVKGKETKALSNIIIPCLCAIELERRNKEELPRRNSNGGTDKEEQRGTAKEELIRKRSEDWLSQSTEQSGKAKLSRPAPGRLQGLKGSFGANSSSDAAKESCPECGTLVGQRRLVMKGNATLVVCYLCHEKITADKKIRYNSTPNPRSGQINKAKAASCVLPPAKARTEIPKRQPATRTGPTRQVKAKVVEESIELLSSDDEEGGGVNVAEAKKAGYSLRERGRVGSLAGGTHQGDAQRFKGFSCRFPPEDGKHSVDVIAEDLGRLEPEEFLNDTIIDFYIKWIEDKMDPDFRSKCYFFNSFFYKKLSEKITPGSHTDHPSATKAASQPSTHPQQITPGSRTEHPLTTATAQEKKNMRHKANFDRVKKWTKGIDLFSYSYVFVPIHAGLHWSLVIICHPGMVDGDNNAESAGNGPLLMHCDSMDGPFLMHCDSMDGGHPTNTIFENLRSYLFNEWQRKSEEAGDNVPRRWMDQRRSVESNVQPPDFRNKNVCFGCPMSRLPNQDNHCDCGLFLLSFIEFFCHARPDITRGAVQEFNKKKTAHSNLLSDTLLPEQHVHKGFLSEDWFDVINAGNLRGEIRSTLLSLMADKNHATGGDIISEMRDAVEAYRKKGPLERYLHPEEFMQHFDQRREMRLQDAAEKHKLGQELRADRRSQRASVRDRAFSSALDNPEGKVLLKEDDDMFCDQPPLKSRSVAPGISEDKAKTSRSQCASVRDRALSSALENPEGKVQLKEDDDMFCDQPPLKSRSVAPGISEDKAKTSRSQCASVRDRALSSALENPEGKVQLKEDDDMICDQPPLRRKGVPPGSSEDKAKAGRRGASRKDRALSSALDNPKGKVQLKEDDDVICDQPPLRSRRVALGISEDKAKAGRGGASGKRSHSSVIEDSPVKPSQDEDPGYPAPKPNSRIGSVKHSRVIEAPSMDEDSQLLGRTTAQQGPTGKQQRSTKSSLQQQHVSMAPRADQPRGTAPIKRNIGVGLEEESSESEQDIQPSYEAAPTKPSQANCHHSTPASQDSAHKLGSGPPSAPPSNKGMDLVPPDSPKHHDLSTSLQEGTGGKAPPHRRSPPSLDNPPPHGQSGLQEQGPVSVAGIGEEAGPQKSQSPRGSRDKKGPGVKGVVVDTNTELVEKLEGGPCPGRGETVQEEHRKVGHGKRREVEVKDLKGRGKKQRAYKEAGEDMEVEEGDEMKELVGRGKEDRESKEVEEKELKELKGKGKKHKEGKEVEVEEEEVKKLEGRGKEDRGSKKHRESKEVEEEVEELKGKGKKQEESKEVEEELKELKGNGKEDREKKELGRARAVIQYTYMSEENQSIAIDDSDDDEPPHEREREAEVQAEAEAVRLEQPPLYDVLGNMSGSDPTGEAGPGPGQMKEQLALPKQAWRHDSCKYRPGEMKEQLALPKQAWGHDSCKPSAITHARSNSDDEDEGSGGGGGEGDDGGQQRKEVAVTKKFSRRDQCQHQERAGHSSDRNERSSKRTRGRSPSKEGGAPQSTHTQSVPAQGVPAQSIHAQSVPAQSVPAQSVPTQSIHAPGVPAQSIPHPSGQANQPNKLSQQKQPKLKSAIVVPACSTEQLSPPSDAVGSDDNGGQEGGPSPIVVPACSTEQLSPPSDAVGSDDNRGQEGGPSPIVVPACSTEQLSPPSDAVGSDDNGGQEGGPSPIVVPACSSEQLIPTSDAVGSDDNGGQEGGPSPIVVPACSSEQLIPTSDAVVSDDSGGQEGGPSPIVVPACSSKQLSPTSDGASDDSGGREGGPSPIVFPAHGSEYLSPPSDAMVSDDSGGQEGGPGPIVVSAHSSGHLSLTSEDVVLGDSGTQEGGPSPVVVLAHGSEQLSPSSDGKSENSGGQEGGPGPIVVSAHGSGHLSPTSDGKLDDSGGKEGGLSPIVVSARGSGHLSSTFEDVVLDNSGGQEGRAGPIVVSAHGSGHVSPTSDAVVLDDSGGQEGGAGPIVVSAHGSGHVSPTYDAMVSDDSGGLEGGPCPMLEATLSHYLGGPCPIFEAACLRQSRGA